MINYLQVENLTKSYGDLVLFDNISFTIGEGQRIALIGRNGSGKTTLLNILAGKDTADSGTITPRRDLRIAYLEQNPEYAADLTVLEACFRSDNPALRAIAAYEQAVADPAQDGLQEAMSRMDALAAWDYEQRAKEIAELEAVKAKKQGQVERQEQRLKELAPAVRNMEQLAAQFSDDPERILPEPGPLESAKSYREKKAKPLLAQIVKVLRSLYRAYVELKMKYERLQGDYGRAREGNERLSDRLQETKLENKALRGAVADFERVKRAFGPEEVERAVEDAKRREAQEREQKKAKRRFRRGAR